MRLLEFQQMGYEAVEFAEAIARDPTLVIRDCIPTRDDRRPDEIALGNHCCEGGMVFEARFLGTSHDGHARRGERNRQINSVISDEDAGDYPEPTLKEGCGERFLRGVLRYRVAQSAPY
ncbi:MAG: hypothetical protein M0D54_10720 [Hyphomonadaceae bacterium JAD_PAG50586_4]|nr:MAG: hypothetical protein M0D54_10720 [Hyphomonadaceae bacterium JAD_PAG50586_4]